MLLEFFAIIGVLFSAIFIMFVFFVLVKMIEIFKKYK